MSEDISLQLADILAKGSNDTVVGEFVEIGDMQEAQAPCNGVCQSGSCMAVGE